MPRDRLRPALLSAVLTNDVVCFALTPLLASSLLAAGRSPIPYLVALATASNLGSALTPIGNPQNILIAQSLHLPFLPFFLTCLPPVVLSLAALYALLLRPARAASPSLPLAPACGENPEEPPLLPRQAAKAVLLTVATIALFLSPVPPSLTALGVSGVVLTSRRMHTRDVLALVDWHLLALFVGLFVVGRGLALSGWTVYARAGLLSFGVDLSHPVTLALTVALLGLLVGNVPAVMLLLPFVPGTAAEGHTLALASTFAGNSVLVGSIANLIVVEQAARYGIRIGFRDHLRYALPTALVSLGIAAATLLLLR